MIIYLQMIESDADKSKFEIIYHEYKGLMYHIAYKYLKHQQDAEDAVHHAFVKIVENISKISEKIIFSCNKTLMSCISIMKEVEA